MTAQFHVPSITETDLLRFHAEVYGKTFHGNNSLWQQTQQQEEAINFGEDVDHDGLGYYDNGVKRTLTDEQIAIFRNSEIQALLRQQQKKEVASSPGHQTVPHSLALKDGAWGFVNANDINAHHEGGPSNEVGEAEYGGFSETERNDFQARTLQQRQITESLMGKDRKVSTRRMVRELDDADRNNDILNYDETKPSERAPIVAKEFGVNAGLASVLVDSNKGRKIWWPRIGD